MKALAAKVLPPRAYEALRRAVYPPDVFTVGYGGRRVRIDPSWRVLDVGSGHNPFPRADVLLEKEAGESAHRAGQVEKRLEHQKIVMGDATAMPFRDKEFDYAVASHIAEHIEDIPAFMGELQRVARRGYIETPGPLTELLLCEPVHVWRVENKGGVLVFRRKNNLKPVFPPFYSFFYLNRERAFKTYKSGMFPVRKLSDYVRREWKYLPLTFTKYEWDGEIRFRVVD